MPEERAGRLRGPSQSEAVAGTAFVAAHLAMILEVIHTTGPFGGRLAAALCFTNLLFAVFVRLIWRFRMVAILAIFSTTAMTEALFWRSAWEGSRNRDLLYAGLQGLLFLVVFSIVFHLLERGRKR
jgi:hypothetical protein